MTKILSVETSTAACSVALAVGDEVVQRYALASDLFAGGYSVRPEEALPVYLRGKEAWALSK